MKWKKKIYILYNILIVICFTLLKVQCNWSAPCKQGYIDVNIIQNITSHSSISTPLWRIFYMLNVSKLFCF